MDFPITPPFQQFSAPPRNVPHAGFQHSGTTGTLTKKHLRSLLNEARCAGLNIWQAEALCIVDELQNLTVGTLAGYLKGPSASVTHVADSLVKLGYIDRFHDTHDRRRVWLRILPAGSAAVGRIISVAHDCPGRRDPVRK